MLNFLFGRRYLIVLGGNYPGHVVSARVTRSQLVEYLKTVKGVPIYIYKI